MLDWKDVTCYSQGQRGKIPPNSWQVKRGKIAIWVSCAHRFYPDEWVMACHSLNIEGKSLGKISDISEDVAKGSAVNIATCLALGLYEEMIALRDAT